MMNCFRNVCFFKLTLLSITNSLQFFLLSLFVPLLMKRAVNPNNVSVDSVNSKDFTGTLATRELQFSTQEGHFHSIVLIALFSLRGLENSIISNDANYFTTII